MKTLLRQSYQVSNTQLKRLKQQPGGLLRNGAPVFVTAVLSAGDRLHVSLEDTAGPPVLPCCLPLDICWEDDFFLVVNKPPGLAVHPSALTEEAVTLAGGIAGYLGPSCGFHPVNRLDRGTSGLMVVAKSGYIHDRFRKILHTSDFQREYRAICVGTPSPAKGVVDGPIGRAPDSLLRREVSLSGSPARTAYEVLETGGAFSLVRLVPFTGRTHQLRVHMASIGHPLVGDWLYGTEDRRLIARPALHAASLVLRHPMTGQWLRLSAPLPADMRALWEGGCD